MPRVLHAAQPDMACTVQFLPQAHDPVLGGIITGDKEGFVYLSRSIKAFPDQKSYAAMLEDAGFHNVSWKNFTGGIAAVHTAVK